MTPQPCAPPPCRLYRLQSRSISPFHAALARTSNSLSLVSMQLALLDWAPHLAVSPWQAAGFVAPGADAGRTTRGLHPKLPGVRPAGRVPLRPAAGP
ncbi:poly-beta-hydroxybutyrate polymerase N-terminal domain-containing protein [Streptomyces sp. L7]